MRFDTSGYTGQSTETEIDGLDGMPWVFSEEAETELRALKRLTDLGCKATPKLLDFKVEVQTKDDMLEGAYALYMLMEKAPGQNLLNFGQLSMAERNEARIAFGTAIRYFDPSAVESTMRLCLSGIFVREFYSYGYRHEDPHPGNVIWDPESKKCHIVDLEDLNDDEYALRPAWVGDFYAWSLYGPGDWRSKDVDPMVASLDYGQKMPDEAELRRVANVTMEKGLDVVKGLRSKRNKKPLLI